MIDAFVEIEIGVNHMERNTVNQATNYSFPGSRAKQSADNVAVDVLIHTFTIGAEYVCIIFRHINL